MNKTILSSLKAKNPLILNITNYVTVNDVANSQLAIGASPVMTDELCDVKQMAKIANAINLNIGTLNKRTIKSMFVAGKIANKFNKPIVLDPVGVGATDFRTKTCIKLIKKIHFDVIKGNISEIKSLANIFCKNDTIKLCTTKGVDVNQNDIITEHNLIENILIVRNLSKATKSIVAATGKFDLISDGQKCFIVKNGHKLMEKVCGTGCMISGIMAAFVATNLENKLQAITDCICMMGIAGEKAVLSLSDGQANSTLKEKIIDNLMLIDDNILQHEAKVEVR